MQLARFPRVRLAHLPTPLEPMERLSRHLGGPRLLVKRDDCTGLALGGNKTRKLEFALGEALAQGADCVITTGGLQSNHVRQTAAAAAHLGLACHLVLRPAVPATDPDYAETGNLFLDRLLGATLHAIPAEADRDAEMARLAARLHGEGAKPYLIPAGASNAVGGLGYAAQAIELIAQAEARDLAIDRVVVATGSGGTQGGLVAGVVARHADIAVIGIDIDAEGEAVDARVAAVGEATGALLGVPEGTVAAAVRVVHGYAGEAYGVPTPAMVEAVTLLARLEGLVLDPVYTGKAMAGLIDLVGKGTFGRDETVVFVHTGGMPALFAYRSAFAGITG